MKARLAPKYIHLLLHVLIWGTLLLLPYLIANAADAYRIGFMPGLFFTLTVCVHMALFYGNAYYLYPRLWNRHWWWLYILSSVLAVIASSWLKYFITATGFPDLLQRPATYRFIVIPSVIVYFISIVYRNIIDKIQSEREQKERQAAQLQTELKFLRSQISPHFLFNVLTNMVSLSRKNSDRLEPSLIMLADLMRYMLYDTLHQKVSLEKEITYLNNYIMLQQLRFGNDVQIDCTIDLDAEAKGTLIEPMLLIPFVENAFKHGIDSTDNPRISVRLSVHQGAMVFNVQNQVTEAPAPALDAQPGIGLQNVRSRLELLYKDRYTLQLDEQHGLFDVTLTLKLV